MVSQVFHTLQFVEDKDILPTRTISVWFHGNCAADQNEAVAYGMRMRVHVVNIIRKQILDQNNIAVSCAFHRPVRKSMASPH